MYRIPKSTFLSRNNDKLSWKRTFSSVTGLNSEALMHNSVIPTYHYQASLPRLPIPDLDHTLDKYLYFAEPVVNAQAFEAAKKHVEAFRQGEGKSLQEELVETDKGNNHTSYISEMWYDMYLRNRASFPLNLTPQLTWIQDPNPQKNDPAVKSANIIASAVRYFRSLNANVLKPDVFALNPPKYEAEWYQRLISLLPEAVSYYAAYAVNAYPLDMSQYKRLFSSTRLPKLEKDELVSFQDSRHVIVMRGAKFYKIEVIDEKGIPTTPEVIEGQIRGILTASESQDKKAPAVGALTGWDRDNWAKTRSELEQSPENAAILHDIDSALFVLTLDDSSPESHEEIARTMLHGDCRNRWFDKSINLIVCQNGRAGIIWEHAWGDGVAVLNFFNEVYKEIMATSERTPAERISVGKGNDTMQPVELAFNLNEKLTKQIQTATKYNSDLINRLDLDIFQSESLTKEDIKKSKFSPDGVMQMVLQLAHWRAHGYTPSTYESASTAGFKHGRTETIRSATLEAKEMCQLFSEGGSVERSAKRAALQKACANHFKITRDCLMGKGVDRHLFALNKYAQRRSWSPEMFHDDAWNTMQNIRLSTSTLSSPALDGGGFGPVNDTSYGVGYGTAERGVHFSVCSYGVGNRAFVDCIEKALQDFHDVMRNE